LGWTHCPSPSYRPDIRSCTEEGLGGDDVTFAFSAPIQPGNSGGPVLDDEGGVIGITMAKLDDRKTLEHAGLVAQNVNFAIKASTVREMLRST
jgi:S1-C subfamily serine protease